MKAGREREKEEQPHSKLQWFGVSSVDSSGDESSLKSHIPLIPVKPDILLKLLCLGRCCKGSTCSNVISSDHGLKSRPTHADTAKSICWMQAHDFGRPVTLKRMAYFYKDPKRRSGLFSLDA